MKGHSPYPRPLNDIRYQTTSWIFWVSSFEAIQPRPKSMTPRHVQKSCANAFPPTWLHPQFHPPDPCDYQRQELKYLTVIICISQTKIKWTWPCCFHPIDIWLFIAKHDHASVQMKSDIQLLYASHSSGSITVFNGIYNFPYVCSWGVFRIPAISFKNQPHQLK